jgi:hypothetical protein
LSGSCRFATGKLSMKKLLVSSVIALAQLSGCGSSTEQEPKTASHASDDVVVVAKPESRLSPKGKIPKRCAKGKKHKNECVPPPGWVRRLCEDVYPDVALHMFRPGTPWKRLYMVSRAEPFNASGGASLLGDKLEPGEEVIALKRRDGNSGVQVGDTSGYDVLRLNGSCATIHDGDFSAKKPDDVVYSKLEWRRIGLPLRNALEASPDVSAAYEARRKACKGQNLGTVAADCERNDRALADEVVRYVLAGKTLPPPEKLP